MECNHKWRQYKNSTVCVKCNSNIINVLAEKEKQIVYMRKCGNCYFKYVKGCNNCTNCGVYIGEYKNWKWDGGNIEIN